MAILTYYAALLVFSISAASALFLGLKLIKLIKSQNPNWKIGIFLDQLYLGDMHPI